MSANAARIRALNDEFRQTLKGGMAVITPGIAALGPQAVERIVATVMTYNDFCRDNDPYGEHDFGAFEAEGETVFFKIEYFDPSLGAHSVDPIDPKVTRRIMTLMLSSEY